MHAQCMYVYMFTSRRTALWHRVYSFQIPQRTKTIN